MSIRIRRITFGLLAAGVVSFCAFSVDAQQRAATRNDRTLSNVGRGSASVGSSAVSRMAASYSGRTSVARPTGGTGPTINYTLRSSSGGTSPFASFSAPIVSTNASAGTRSTLASFSSEPGGSSAMQTRRVAPAAGPRLNLDENPSGISSVFSNASPGGIFEMGPGGSLLADAVDIDDPNAVASFAPSDDSAYAKCMKDGEFAFRNQRYGTAFAQFESAHRIAGDPESLLSMAHAKFAAGSYPSSAMYLRMVLREVPQLPRISLRPRSFYGDRTVYVRDMRRLDDFMARFPDNPDGALLQAYFSWFDPDRGPVAALQAIADGLSNPNQPQATQALEMLQESILSVLQELADEPKDDATASREVSG